MDLQTSRVKGQITGKSKQDRKKKKIIKERHRREQFFEVASVQSGSETDPTQQSPGKKRSRRQEAGSRSPAVGGISLLTDSSRAC